MKSLENVCEWPREPKCFYCTNFLLHVVGTQQCSNSYIYIMTYLVFFHCRSCDAVRWFYPDYAFPQTLVSLKEHH